MLSTIQRHHAHKHGDETELGFTLIELLIVIVVLGVLAGVTVFALGGVAGKSAQAACNSDASAVNVALQAWNAQNSGVTVPATQALWASALAPTYLQTYPTSTHYTITISTTTPPAVMVATTAVPVAAAYVIGSSTNPCSSAA